jgi:small subunit ribosomal protein S16
MLKIRLRKPGKSIKRRYHSKIVVIEAKSARDARFVAQLGYYDPSQKLLKIDIPKYEAWIKKGAQPTETVATLFKKYKKESQAGKKGE